MTAFQMSKKPLQFIQRSDNGGKAAHKHSEMCRGDTYMAGTTATADKKTKKAASSTGAARGGIAAPVQPSPELAEIVGTAKLPRSEVVSKVWEYIKKHDLQNPKDKREILADDKLQKVFDGKKQVSMFEMNKHLSKHLK
jgi:chromatin remodeling complex protein RSC6